MSKPTGYRLTHKITILHDISADTDDAPKWEALFDGIFAEKQGLSERLFYGAGITKSDDSATFITHYSKALYDGIRPNMRLVDNGNSENAYEILGTPTDIYDDRRWLKIHARRNVSG